MYFIVESQEQLEKMEVKDECFVHVIQLNDNYHPALTSASLVYYNDFNKGYIFGINHSEAFSLDLKDVQAFINKHKKAYVLDEKRQSYFLKLKNAVDLNFTIVDQKNEIPDVDCYTNVHTEFYRNFPDQSDVNRLIPIAKIYEYCECMFEFASQFVEVSQNKEVYDKYLKAYRFVEKSGIKIDLEHFKNHFTLNNERFSVKDSIIYTSYNLYNLTQRPTNSFNGFNALSIPKDKEVRKCVIPRNNFLLEFDFDAYHLRIIAKLIGYEMPSESIHKVLARQYFKKQEISDVEYQESKKITFRQLYGGVEDQYKDIEFFKALEGYADEQYKKYKKSKGYTLPTGRILKPSTTITKYKLFNYIVQNMETVINVEKILEIRKLLKDKETKLILITYDSFLFDVSVTEGKQLLLDIKAILEKDGFQVKYKHGKDYAL